MLWVVVLMVVPVVRVPQLMHRVMALPFVSIVRVLPGVVVRLVCAADGATGGGEAGGAIAWVLQAMQRVMGELQRVLQVVQLAVVPLVMSMVRVLQVMAMMWKGADVVAVGDGAVGDVDGGGAAVDVAGDGDANVADGEGDACDLTGGGCEGAVGDASGGDGLVMSMECMLSVM